MCLNCLCWCVCMCLGVSGLTVRASRRITIHAVIYIMSSSLIAVITGETNVSDYQQLINNNYY